MDWAKFTFDEFHCDLVERTEELLIFRAHQTDTDYLTELLGADVADDVDGVTISRIC